MFYFFMEYADLPVKGAVPVFTFQAVTPRNVVGLDLSKAGEEWTGSNESFLMLISGSPGSTAGGLEDDNTGSPLRIGTFCVCT